MYNINECKTHICTVLNTVLGKRFDKRLQQEIISFVKDAIKTYFGEIIEVYCVMVEQNVVNIYVEDRFLFDWIDDKYGKAENEKRLWNSY